MAIRSKTAPSAVENARPIICTVGEYKGTETLSVGPEGGRPDWNITAGPAKWERLFVVDPDGDTILAGVFGFVASHTNDMNKLTNTVDKFVQEYLAWKAEYFGEDQAAPAEPEQEEMPTPVVEEPAVQAQPVVEERPALTQAQKDLVIKRLKAETKLYRLAKPEERAWLEKDALMMAWDGMTFDEYRDSLRAFPTVGDYIKHVS